MVWSLRLLTTNGLSLILACISTVRPRHATLSTEKPKVSYYAFRRNFGTGFALPAKSDNEGDMELAISIIVQQRQMEQLGQLRDHKNQTWTSRAYRYGSSDGE